MRPAWGAGESVHVDEVKRYYEQNTRRFLSFGQGGAEGAIHRAVWAEGVRDRRDAFHCVHDLVWREAQRLANPLRMLDLGCGVGACLQYVSERTPLEGIGITLSPLQVKLARERLANHPTVPLIRFHEGNFEHLPSIEPVHLATAIESFVHCSDPNRFFSEVARVLRPGGRLIICDDFLGVPAASAGPTGRMMIDEFKQGWHAGTLETVTTIDAIARRHGFELATDTDLSPYLELGRWRDRAVAQLVRLGKRVGLRTKYFQSLLGGDALQRCLRSGLVQYRFVVWRATA